MTASKDDGILNVRIIRDPETFLGKGIAYVQFVTKELMRLAIEKRNQSDFKGRSIRVKKAVEAKRLEKKRVKTETMIKERAEKKAAYLEQKTEDEKLLEKRGTKFEDAFESDDSHDEKMERAKKEKKIKDKSKKIKKQDEFAAHAFKIASRGEKVAREINEEGIDITPKLGFNKKKQTLIQK